MHLSRRDLLFRENTTWILVGEHTVLRLLQNGPVELVQRRSHDGFAVLAQQLALDDVGGHRAQSGCQADLGAVVDKHGQLLGALVADGDSGVGLGSQSQQAGNLGLVEAVDLGIVSSVVSLVVRVALDVTGRDGDVFVVLFGLFDSGSGWGGTEHRHHGVTGRSVRDQRKKLSDLFPDPSGLGGVFFPYWNWASRHCADGDGCLLLIFSFVIRWLKCGDWMGVCRI